MDLRDKKVRITALQEAIRDVAEYAKSNGKVDFLRMRDGEMIKDFNYTRAWQRLIGQLIDALPLDLRRASMKEFDMSRSDYAGIEMQVFDRKLFSPTEDNENFFLRCVKLVLVDQSTTANEFQELYQDLLERVEQGKIEYDVDEEAFCLDTREMTFANSPETLNLSKEDSIEGKKKIMLQFDQRIWRKRYTASLFEGMGKLPKVFKDEDLLKVLGFLKQIKAPDLNNELNRAFLVGGMSLPEQIKFLEENPDSSSLSKAIILSTGLLRERDDELRSILWNAVRDLGISICDISTKVPSLDFVKENGYCAAMSSFNLVPPLTGDDERGEK